MICVDASVAAKWLFPETHSPQASQLLRRALDAAVPIVAPPLLASEVTNVIRQRMRQGVLDREGARTLLAQFLAIPIRLRAPAPLYDRALVLADEFALAAVYDAHYVALAELVGATLWTADQRLLRVLGARLPFVRPIAEFDSS